MAKSAFLNRVLANNMIKYEDGKLNFLDVPVHVFILNVLVLMQKAQRDEYREKSDTLFYTMLWLQSRMGAHLMMRYGYSKERAIKEQMGQGEMVGTGEVKLIKADYEKDEYVIRVQSTFAHEYRNTFGVQKDPVDVFLRGGFTGLFMEHCKNPNMIAIETSCIATGKQYCEFVIKDKKKFNLKDPKIKSQIPPKMKFDFDSIVKQVGIPQHK